MKHHGNPEGLVEKKATKRAVAARAPAPAPPEPPTFLDSMGPSERTWWLDKYQEELRQWNSQN